MQPKHYNNIWIRNLTDEEIKAKQIHLVLDPYRICEVLGIGGGAREQIVKKGLRWTGKGDSEEKVITEIMQACERKLAMIKEDK